MTPSQPKFKCSILEWCSLYLFKHGWEKWEGREREIERERKGVLSDSRKASWHGHGHI